MKIVQRKRLFPMALLATAFVCQNLSSVCGAASNSTWGTAAGFRSSLTMSVPASTEPPVQTPPPRRSTNRFIRWLKNIAGIRQLLVPIFPDGKVVHENSLTFRWGWKPTQNPDHFLIRVFEKVGTGPWAEVFVSAAIPGNQRTYTKAPGFDDEPTKTYKWRLEAFERNSSTFTVQSEELFSFLNAAQLAAIQEHEPVYLGWIQQRPDEKHLLLLVGSYYAAEGLHARAREMFTRFLEASGVTLNSSLLSFRELTNLVWQKLGRLEVERNQKQARLRAAHAPNARIALLKELRILNLTLLDYDQAVTNVDALIALSSNPQVREEWQERKSLMLAERTLARELFPGAAVADLPKSEIFTAGELVWSPAAIRRRSLMHHGSAAKPPSKRQAAHRNFSFELDDEQSAWYLADNEIVAKYPAPPKGMVEPSYHLGEEIESLIGGMWKGNLLSGMGGIDRERLRRSMLTFVTRLAKAKATYFAGQERTPALDEAWNLIPETRSMRADEEAFVEFGRLIYPVPLDLGKPETMKKRDELVTYLNKHLELPKGDADDEKYLAQVLLNDIFLVRTSPVFKLSAGNGQNLAAVDSVEVVNEGFAAIDASTLALPPKPDNAVALVLNGSCSDLTAKLKRDRSAQKPSNQILIRFDSRQRGSYRLRIQLRSGPRIIWRSPSFGLYFV